VSRGAYLLGDLAIRTRVADGSVWLAAPALTTYVVSKGAALVDLQGSGMLFSATVGVAAVY
jgi:hypothetical protein